MCPSTPWPKDTKEWEKRYERESNLPLRETADKPEPEPEESEDTE